MTASKLNPADSAERWTAASNASLKEPAAHSRELMHACIHSFLTV